MNCFRADLHIHTALSPCADEEMTPPNIVTTALARELDIIAICDHNAASNVEAVQQAAREIGWPIVLAGIEITTAEEIHVLGIFDQASQARHVAEHIQRTLPIRDSESTISYLGDQYCMNAQGDIVGTLPFMLDMASQLTLEETVDFIHANHGLAIASHVDRPSFSVYSQLGLFPENVPFDAIELSAVCVHENRMHPYQKLPFPLVTSVDAHFLSELGDHYTELILDEPTFEEITAALRGTVERSIQIV